MNTVKNYFLKNRRADLTRNSAWPDDAIIGCGQEFIDRGNQENGFFDRIGLITKFSFARGNSGLVL